jgi:transcriptional regulator with XRE-family HTH domain
LVQTNNPANLVGRFADNLRRLRLKRGLSQEELAGLVGIHRTEVSILERAGREPRLKILLRLAGGLDVSIDELTDGLTWRPSGHEDSRSGSFSVSSERSEDDDRPFDRGASR